MGFLKQMQNKYNKEITNEYDIFKHDLELCIKDSFNDDFTCINKINNFSQCIENFNSKLKKNIYKVKPYKLYINCLYNKF